MSYTRLLSVTGLGYVGLQVACAFARRGHRVVAFDIDVQRIAKLRAGCDRTAEIGAADLALPVLAFTADPRDLAAAVLKDCGGLVTDVPACLDRATTPEGVHLWRP